MSKKKDQMVYIVEDCEMSPGQILAVFANEEDACVFSMMYDGCSPSYSEVLPRKLWYSQPSILGVNK